MIISLANKINYTKPIYLGSLPSDKVINNSAGGTYVFDGTEYTETLEFGLPGMIPYVGVKQAYRVRVDQNKMYLSGLLSVAGMDNKLSIEEIWERIE